MNLSSLASTAFQSARSSLKAMAEAAQESGAAAKGEAGLTEKAAAPATTEAKPFKSRTGNLLDSYA